MPDELPSLWIVQSKAKVNTKWCNFTTPFKNKEEADQHLKLIHSQVDFDIGLTEFRVFEDKAQEFEIVDDNGKVRGVILLYSSEVGLFSSPGCTLKNTGTVQTFALNNYDFRTDMFD